MHLSVLCSGDGTWSRMPRAYHCLSVRGLMTAIASSSTTMTGAPMPGPNSVLLPFSAAARAMIRRTSRGKAAAGRHRLFFAERP